MCVGGAFDLLHPGHIRFLEQARTLGDILVVAMESDEAVRARFARQQDAVHRNSTARPITPAAERAEILAALTAVDYVTLLEGPLPDFLARVRPEIVAVAGAKDAASELRRDFERLGCKIARVAPEPGYSTSLLIERIFESHS